MDVCGGGGGGCCCVLCCCGGLFKSAKFEVKFEVGGWLALFLASGGVSGNVFENCGTWIAAVGFIVGLLVWTSVLVTLCSWGVSNKYLACLRTPS